MSIVRQSYTMLEFDWRQIIDPKAVRLLCLYLNGRKLSYVCSKCASGIAQIKLASLARNIRWVGVCLPPPSPTDVAPGRHRSTLPSVVSTGVGYGLWPTILDGLLFVSTQTATASM